MTGSNTDSETTVAECRSVRHW